MSRQDHIELADARALGRELERHLRHGDRSGIPQDLGAILRASVVGEPLETPDGVQLPPWRIASHTATEVELTWTIDLGHDSGTRRWFVARAERAGDGWTIRGVSFAHARRARP